ncbi:MAG: hypothetical protein JNK87_25700 [Bryobacterales bacterium]|nr:hypothetical protein [Bryobacterales bacterium]
MVAVLLALSISGALFANPTNAPADRACSQCHTGNAENPGRILIEFAAFQYTPGVQQQVKVHILQNRLPGATNFQMTARLASNELAPAGTFLASSTTQILTQNGLPYITNNGLNGTTVYTFAWTPPATNVGSIRFFVSAVGGDLNGTPSGNAFTASYTMAPASLDLPAGFRRQPITIPGSTWIEPHAVASNGTVSGRYRPDSSSGTGTSLVFNVAPGSTTQPLNQSVTVNTPAPAQFTATATVTGTLVQWLAAGPSIGQTFSTGGPATATVNVGVQNFVILPAGSYNGIITVTFTSGGYAPRVIPVTLNVGGTPVGFLGFLGAAGNGNVTTFTPPGDLETFVANSSGNGAGTYVVNNQRRAFLRSADGTITLFDVPGATSTALTAINDNGTVTGTFTDASNATHVLQLTTPANFTFFDVAPANTQIAGISNSGSISGNANRTGFVTIDNTPIGYLTCGSELNGGNVAAGVNDNRYVAGYCRARVGSLFGTTNFVQAPNGRRLDILEGTLRGLNNSLQTTLSLNSEASFLLTPCQASPAPTFTVITAPAAGGTTTIPLTTTPDCIVNAISESPWLRVTPHTAGNANLIVTADPNPTSNTRTGTIWVAGSLVSIQQPAADCNFQLSGGPSTFLSQGGTGILTITGPPGCTWTATPSASWIVPSATTGIGNLSFTVQPNNGTQTRTGTLQIGAAAFTILQAGAPTCSYTLLTLTATNTVPATGGTIPIAVNTGAGCPWTIQTGAAWITFQNGSGTGTGTFNAIIAPNNTNAARLGTITAGNGSLSLQQPSAQTQISGLRFIPITPCRLADTRSTAKLAQGETRNFPVLSPTCNIPPTARAYSLNTTVVPDGYLGYLTVYPAGQIRPPVSTLNSWNGRVVANAAIVEAGNVGDISVYADNPTHVILDINGYFVDRTVPNGLSFYPLPPCRIGDTRGQPRPAVIGPMELTFNVRGVCGTPANAQAYSLNLTAIPERTLAFATLYPTGLPRPNASTLNSFDGQVVPNAALVPAGFNGQVTVFGTDTFDAVLDINGYFAPPGQPNALAYNTITPCRAADTRTSDPIQAGATRYFPMAGTVCNLPSTAGALVVNATAVPGTPYLGYVSFWPRGLPQPLVSTLNSFNGQVVANMAIVPTGEFGNISAFASNVTELILDTSGYFAPDPGN